MRGKDGVHYIEVRVNGEVIGSAKDFEDIPPISGSDLYLTIDNSLQNVAESLMSKIDRGTMVAIDPRNGDILAMVSKPDFDLNVFTLPMKDSVWISLNDYRRHPLLNRSIQGLYPPSSAMKLVGASIAIDKGYANAKTKMPTSCQGSIFYGDRWFNCWLKTGHGSIDLVEAIAVSCDVYFYQLGLMIGLDDWSYYTKLCNFGVATGIDLPSESKGFVPTREYLNERYGRMGWSKGSMLNLVIGQGETTVTPLQMLVFMAAVGRRGAIYRPRVVKRIVPPVGRAVEIKEQSVGRLPFSEDALNLCVEGCVRTVNEPWETGAGAYLEDVVVAGKTGTAQNPHGENHAWFISFAPADKPRIALMTMIEHGGSGGSYGWMHYIFYDYYFHYWERGFGRLDNVK